MAATLLVKDPKGRRVEIRLNPVNTLGRGPEQNISLNDMQASRRHAAISWADGHFWLQDRASLNGTYLNGVLVFGPTRLCDGDLIVMGDCTLLFSDTCRRASKILEPDRYQIPEDKNGLAERMSHLEFASVEDSSCSGSLGD